MDIILRDKKSLSKVYVHEHYKGFEPVIHSIPGPVWFVVPQKKRNVIKLKTIYNNAVALVLIIMT